MNGTVAGLIGATAIVLALGAGAAWAETKITVTREESKPQKLEVKLRKEPEGAGDGLVARADVRAGGISPVKSGGRT